MHIGVCTFSLLNNKQDFSESGCSYITSLSIGTELTLQFPAGGVILIAKLHIYTFLQVKEQFSLARTVTGNMVPIFIF